MKRSQKILKTISWVLVVAMLNLCLTSSYAWAATAQGFAMQDDNAMNQTSRQQLKDLLNRQDVQEQLMQYGISREEASARIDALTDDEVATLLDVGMDRVPAGGNVLAVAVYGALGAAWLAVYLLGVIGKGTSCILHLGCKSKGGADWVFKPWWEVHGVSASEYEEDFYGVEYEEDVDGVGEHEEDNLTYGNEDGY